MKKTIFLSLLLAVTIAFTGCSKSKDENLKVVDLVVVSAVKGMDPILASDRYSSNEIGRVYEGLLQYHYLKRPYTLEPNLAESMPVVSKDGLTYTFKIRKGVLFQDDPAFPNGKGRELIAEDFVYSIKRLADPKTQALGWWVLDGKIKGLNEWRKVSLKAEKTDYSTEIEGLKALDRYTLQFKLAKPFPQFQYALAMSFTFAVAKEVVDKYGKEFINHPVGTGPFRIEGGRFTQSNKIRWEKNPTFRDKFYPTEGSEYFKNNGFLADAGKKLPLADKIVVHIIEEDQPRWLNFLKGKTGFISIPKDNFDAAINSSKELDAEFAKKGVTLRVLPSLDITYTGFNHDMPLFKNKKLRQAMSLAYDVNESNKLFYNDRGIPAQSIVPPGIAGHIEGYKNPFRNKDLTKAKKLLAEAGYPEGKGLQEITYDITASTTARQMGEFFKRSMAEIGIKVRLIQNSWPELTKKINTTRNIMLWGIAWGADYPDAENFLQLLYGPNKSPGANGTNFQNDEYDSIFKKASVMQDSPERTKLYEKMTKMAAEEAPVIYGVHRQIFYLTHSWMKNYIYSDLDTGNSQYYNVDIKGKKEWIKKHR